MNQGLNISKGVRYMMIAALAFSVMGALIKQVNHIHIVQIVFFRSIITAATCTVLLTKKKVSLLGENQFLLILRSILGLISMTLFFITIQRIPFGASVTLRYLAPFFSIILAVWLLKEKANWMQWIFFVLAIVGVFIMKGFDTRIDNLSLFYSLTSAVLVAGVYVTIKKIGNSEHPLVIINYFMGITTIISGILLFFFWEPVTMYELGVLVLVGVMGYFGQRFMTISLQVESIVNVAPFKYLELVYAFAIGYFIFGEGYSWMSLIGICCILIAVIANFKVKSEITT